MIYGGITFICLVYITEILDLWYYSVVENGIYL
jgi:hypothetical protein